MKFIINTANKCVNTTFGYLIFLVLISSVTACERCIKEEPRDGKLLISLTSATLIDDQKTFQLKLVPQDAKKIVEYKNYQLKMTLSAESGDLKGTKIKYKSFDTGTPTDQEITSDPVVKNLTHFFRGAVLEPGDTPEEKFIVEPGHGVGKLIFVVELLDVLQDNKSVTVCQGTWELGSLPMFAIEITNKEAASGKIVADNKMSLEMTRTDGGDIVAKDLNKLALKIDRLAGNKAKISTAPNTDPSYTFLLKDVLSRVTFSPDKKTATLDLMIEPDSDKKATFSIEPLSEWDGITSMGTAQSVGWDNGADLGLKAVYDPATKKVEVTVTNKGKLPLPVNQAKLNWVTGNAAVTINGNQQGAQDIPILNVGGNTIIYLDNVGFADPNKAPSANLDLELTWSELENPVTLPLPCVLTAIPVDITLTKLEFDKLNGQIKYNIINNHPTTAIGLTLNCENTKPNTENKAIISTVFPVDLKLAATIPSGEQALQVDFQNEEKADFNIGLLFGGHPINFKFNDGTGEKSVRVAKVHTVAKQVSLKLVDEAGKDFTDNKISLRGANKEIKFKVALKGDLNDLVALNAIEKGRLKLTIKGGHAKEGHAGDAKLKYKGHEVGEIIGNNLELDTANNVELSVQEGHSNKVVFELQLMYDKKGDNNFHPIGDPLTVEWDEDDPLRDIGSLFGGEDD